jgi:flagellar assembly factor FliW
MTDNDMQAVVTPEGIPGFERTRRWTLEREHPDAVFSLLRSVDQPGVGILVAEPWNLAPGYSPDLPDDELARIEIEGPEELELYVVATLSPDRQQVYLNLAAPLAIHSELRIGRQIILDRQGWPLRHPVAVRG